MAEQQKRSTKTRLPKKAEEASVTPNTGDVADVLKMVGSNNKTIMASLIAAAGIGRKRDAMSAVADSIMSSFDTFRKTMSNHIVASDVCFDIEFDERHRTINNVMFTENVTGTQPGNALNVNIDYFNDLYRQKRDPEPPKKYKRHEYIEYKYNVSSLIQYYTKRFPEIMDLFSTFSDICLNKSDIGVSVEFSDEFIQAFFIDEFQKQVEERQRMDDMLAQQAMGITGMDEFDDDYAEFGESDQTVTDQLDHLTNGTLSSEGTIEESDDSPSGLKTITDLFENSDIPPPEESDATTSTKSIRSLLPEDETSDTTNEKPQKTIINLFDSQGKRTDLKGLKGLRKSIGSSIWDETSELDTYSEDQTLVDPREKQIKIYNEIYSSVVYQYNLLISKVEKKIRAVLNNKLIKKVKFATNTADVYGYSILTINKADPHDVNVYNPTEVRLYKKKKSNLDMDNFIFAKIEMDGTEQKLRVLNHQFHCYILSLDPMVMMPIPNIVRISWYLYLLDLVEILIIYNDLLKSKSIHLLEIPVFDPSSTGYDDGQGSAASNVMDSLGLMNMIINNIESKLVMDTEYIQNSDNQEDVAMKLLKNVGLSVAYVPKLSPDSEMKNIRLETDDNQYDKLYTMLNEKIFAVLKFPLWFRTSTQVMATFKAIPREVVQFAHLVFMSRVNSALSELEAFLEFLVSLHSNEFTVSYQGMENQIPVTVENVKITVKSILGEYLFENTKMETARSTKIQNVLTFVSAGFQMNPHFVCQYVFPEYTIADVLLDAGANLETKRQEIENALSGGNAVTDEPIDEEVVEGEEAVPSEEQVTMEKQMIDWKFVRKSFALSLAEAASNDNATLELKNIRKKVGDLLRFKSHKFNIKRV